MTAEIKKEITSELKK